MEIGHAVLINNASSLGPVPLPGDMDTPLHAAAMPDADRSALKRPEQAARELADVIAAALPLHTDHNG